MKTGFAPLQRKLIGLYSKLAFVIQSANIDIASRYKEGNADHGNTIMVTAQIWSPQGLSVLRDGREVCVGSKRQTGSQREPEAEKGERPKRKHIQYSTGNGPGDLRDPSTTEAWALAPQRR